MKRGAVVFICLFLAVVWDGHQYEGMSMQVVNDFGNLLFDDEQKDCKVITANCHGQTFAFIQVLDLGNPGNRLRKPGKRRYWGRFDPNRPEQSIKAIMGSGGKWPMLPGVRRV